MLEQYRGTYRDQHGEEAVLIQNDGTDLHMTLRGVEFCGHSMSSMEPKNTTERPELAQFVLHHYPNGAPDLCACTIEYMVPMPVFDQGMMTTALLTVHTELDLPAERGRLDHELLRLALSVGDQTYQGSGNSGWFEDELLEIQAALPDGVYLKACINCAFSDYSVYGHGIFGDMACFRRCKAAYLAVKDKGDYMSLRCPAVDTVQETYLCPEFERRVPGTGYRG